MLFPVTIFYLFFFSFLFAFFHGFSEGARETNHLSFSSNHHASGLVFKSRAPTACPASVFRRFPAIFIQLRAFILPLTSSSRKVAIHSRLSASFARFDSVVSLACSSSYATLI